MLRSVGRFGGERLFRATARAAGEGFEPSRQPQRLPSCFQGSHVRPLRHPAEPLFEPYLEHAPFAGTPDDTLDAESRALDSSASVAWSDATSGIVLGSSCLCSKS